MSDGLRIDLALARAAGLPPPLASAADAAPKSHPSPASVDPTFSPVALLLARLPASSTAPAPPLTPDEARLLQATLQQRVVAVLRGAGVPVPPALRAMVDADGALRLAPAPSDAQRATQALAQAPDVARLAQWLHATTASASDDARRVDIADVPRPASIVTTPDARRIWPWRVGPDSDVDAARTTRGMPGSTLLLLLAGLLWLAWRLLG